MTTSDGLYDRFLFAARLGRTLIVGSRVTPNKSDRRKRYVDGFGVDMEAGPGVDRVLNLEEPPPADLGRFAHVECTSVLEHSRRPWLLAHNIEKLLVPRGTLFVAAPFVWRIHNYPSDYWRFTTDGIRELFPAIEFQTLAYDRHGVIEAAGLPHFARCEVYGFGRKK